MKPINCTILRAFHILLSANASSACDPAPEQPPRQPVELPGLIIDLEQQLVDLEATVCLDQGLLELVACTRGSKEHESIVAVSARAMHIHATLLLLGADNGQPAMRRQVGDEDPRWVDVPPTGVAARRF